MTRNIYSYGSPQSEHIIRSREPAGIILVNRKVGMHTLRKGAAMSLQLFELVPATPSRTLLDLTLMFRTRGRFYGR